jgi:hypothetical protein
MDTRKLALPWRPCLIWTYMEMKTRPKFRKRRIVYESVAVQPVIPMAHIGQAYWMA